MSEFKVIGIWLCGFALTIVAFLIFGLSLLSYFAAYSESSHQCPDGNDCADAMTAMKFAPIFAAVSGLAVYAGHKLMRISVRLQNNENPKQ